MSSAHPYKGLLIFPILKDLTVADGIAVKNEGIIRGFAENGVAVEVLSFDSGGAYLGGEKLFSFPASRYGRILHFYVLMWLRLVGHILRRKYDFVWMRTLVPNPVLATFISRIGKGLKKAGGKLILEYGAYPFEGELTPRLLRWYRLSINQRAEDKANKAADFIITYCGQDAVDGVPVIPINNGFDLSRVPPPAERRLGDGDTLRIICVSSLKKWHAYDRLLEGLHQYLSGGSRTRNIHLDIIGDGPEMPKMRELAARYSLDAVVTFHGFMTGAEPDAIYAQAHLAIGTLGFHRIGISNSSSLKNREYFGRGLPVVLSTQDKDMPATLPYVLYVPEGEEPVSIPDIVRFAEATYRTPDVNSVIRRYADEHVSWKSKIRVVLQYLSNSGAPEKAASIAHPL